MLNLACHKEISPVMGHFLLSKIFAFNMTDERRQVCGAKNGGEKKSKHEVTRCEQRQTIQ